MHHDASIIPSTPAPSTCSGKPFNPAAEQRATAQITLRDFYKRQPKPEFSRLPVGDWKPSTGCTGKPAACAAPVTATGTSGGFHPIQPETQTSFPVLQGVSRGLGQRPKSDKRAKKTSAETLNTPPANRGVLNASVSVGVDWLNLSLPNACESDRAHLKRVLDVLGSQRKKVNGKFDYSGYDLACFGRILKRKSAQGNGLDYLIELPGQAMEYIREILKINVPDMIRDFQGAGWRVTRLDVAVDTTDARVNPQMVYDWLCTPNVVCKAKQKNPVLGRSDIGEPGNDDGKGMTVYIGRRSSCRFMRVYDKSGEVEAKTGKKIPHMTRFEMEIKQETADVLARQIAKSGENIIPGILHGFIDFKATTGREQMTKRDSAKWWLRIVGNCGKVCPGLTVGISTPEKAEKWQLNQWAQTFALTQKYNPELFDRLNEKANINPDIERLWKARYGNAADTAAAQGDTTAAIAIETGAPRLFGSAQFLIQRT